MPSWDNEREVNRYGKSVRLSQAVLFLMNHILTENEPIAIYRCSHTVILSITVI